MASRLTVRVSAPDFSSCAITDPSGKHQLLARLLHQIPRQIKPLVLHQRVAGFEAHGLEEGAGHCPAQQDLIHLGQQRLDQVDLAADLRPAEHRHEGPLGLVQRLAEVAQLALHEEAGDRRLQDPGDGLGARVSPMRGPEGVVDVQVAEGREPLGQRQIVLLLAGVEAGVFRHRHAAAR